jgi:hypothetical protein
LIILLLLVVVVVAVLWPVAAAQAGIELIPGL